MKITVTTHVPAPIDAVWQAYTTPADNVAVTFDAETIHSEEQQRSGWQAILDNFARHVATRQA